MQSTFRTIHTIEIRTAVVGVQFRKLVDINMDWRDVLSENNVFKPAGIFYPMVRLRGR